MERLVGAGVEASPGEAKDSAVNAVLDTDPPGRRQAIAQPCSQSANQLGLESTDKPTEVDLLPQLAALLMCDPDADRGPETVQIVKSERDGMRGLLPAGGRLSQQGKT